MKPECVKYKTDSYAEKKTLINASLESMIDVSVQKILA